MIVRSVVHNVLSIGKCTGGAKKRIHILRRKKNCIKIVILNIPITKDDYESHLTSAITRGAQSGYHQRLDTSVHNIS